MPREYGNWPDYLRHTVLQKNEKDNNWFITPNPEKWPYVGSGGETYCWGVSVQHKASPEKTLPMVLKSYSIYSMRTDSGNAIIFEDERPDFDICESLTRRQYDGWSILHQYNSDHVAQFPLPPTVRLTKTKHGELSILMTDLTANGIYALVEFKHLLFPEFQTERLRKRLLKIWPGYSDQDRATMCKQGFLLQNKW